MGLLTLDNLCGPPIKQCDYYDIDLMAQGLQGGAWTGKPHYFSCPSSSFWEYPVTNLYSYHPYWGCWENINKSLCDQCLKRCCHKRGVSSDDKWMSGLSRKDLSFSIFNFFVNKNCPLWYPNLEFHWSSQRKLGLELGGEEVGRQVFRRRLGGIEGKSLI